MPPPGGTSHVCTPWTGEPGGAPRYMVSNCSPTTWKLQGCEGPAFTSQKRTRSPSFTLMGSLMYWFGRPLKQTKSGVVASIFW